VIILDNRLRGLKNVEVAVYPAVFALFVTFIGVTAIVVGVVCYAIMWACGVASATAATFVITAFPVTGVKVAVFVVENVIVC
jgi:hypothetical protein